MPNRVYLTCTSFTSMPNETQQGEFRRASGAEYEAKACVPIYWLCLFSAKDIHVLPADHDGFDQDERPYAYLLCQKESGLARLKSRAELVRESVGPDRFGLYLQWIERLESEPFANVIVRTEELDWMGKEGQLERDLRKALIHLEATEEHGILRMSKAMTDIVGLWENEALSDCESFELVGNASAGDAWPSKFVPPASKAVPVPRKKKSWWQLR